MLAKAARPVDGVIILDDDELEPEAAAQLVIAVAGSEEARNAMAPHLPEVDAEQKLVHIVAWLLQDRLEVLELAIERTKSPPPDGDEAARRRALQLLWRVRILLAR